MKRKQWIVMTLVAVVVFLSIASLIQADEWWQCWGDNCGRRCSCREAYMWDDAGCWAKCYMGQTYVECTRNDCGPAM
jgi:hypothetical protein